MTESSDGEPASEEATGDGSRERNRERPYRVLVPVDQNERRAAAQARYVASLPAPDRVEAVLLHVFTHDESEAIPDSLGPYKSADRVGAVREARERLERDGVAVTPHDASGDPAEAILAAASDYDVDAVVVGGRKRSTAQAAVFGSVTQSVIHGTTVPVVVTGSDHGGDGETD